MTQTTTCDVLVLGGGLAGLSAALQIKRERPRTRVVVVEKREHPVPEAAYKVGESASEIGAHYLKEIVGLRDHMENEQLRKFSLRIFSTRDGNADIARRPEFGLGRISPLRTYQIDRGRLENALAQAADAAGAELLEGHTVASVELGPDRHEATVRGGERERTFSAKWIVDASGRAGLLRRQLRLTVDIPHDVNAAWFRLARHLRVDEWSQDPAWRARVPAGNRWLSTCHLVGEGYWVWLIPLASGGHSVGVVADPRFVPFERIRRYDALLEWAWEHEPELASKLPAAEDGLQDFHKLKNYAYGVRRGLSPQRWCLTGEAGLFLDPLYSTGLDFIAVANTLSSRLICGALEDEPDLSKRLKAYNSYYLGQFLSWEPAFAGQYEVFRDAQATSAKVTWDNASYFFYPVLLFNKGLMLDYEFVAEMREVYREHFSMNVHMQRFFREWSRIDDDAKHAAGFPFASDAMIGQTFERIAGPLSKDEVSEMIHVNVARLRAVSHQLLTRMSEAAGVEPDLPPWADAGADWDEELLSWSPYEQRTEPPALAAAQPEEAWMLR
jgi:flavin-dependent dehydrogenase